MRKTKWAISLISVLIILPTEVSIAAAKPISGAKCAKLGITQSYGGKNYTCIKLGSKLYWNNGVNTPARVSPTPSPTQKPINEILGATLRQDDTGRILQAVIVQEIATGRVAYAGDNGEWKTAFKTNFEEQDLYLNYVLGCPKSADCTQSTYISTLNQNSAQEIYFGSITHPGNFAAIFLKEADFGQNQDEIFAHLKFSSRGDGASDIIVRYDVPTKTITPIFVTYCNSLGTGSACSSGASINGLRVSRLNSTIYFVLNQGILDINNLKSTQSIVSLPMNAPTQKIGTPEDAGKKSWDGEIKNRFVYTHNDASTTIDDLDFSEKEDAIFVITRGRKDVGLNNGYCKIALNTGTVECAQLEPFNFISNIVPMSKNSLLYESFSGFSYYEMDSKRVSTISNTYRFWPLDLSK